MTHHMSVAGWSMICEMDETVNCGFSGADVGLCLAVFTPASATGGGDAIVGTREDHPSVSGLCRRGGHLPSGGFTALAVSSVEILFIVFFFYYYY